MIQCFSLQFHNTILSCKHQILCSLLFFYQLSLLEDQLASLRNENEALKASMDKRKVHEVHKKEMSAFQVN